MLQQHRLQRAAASQPGAEPPPVEVELDVTVVDVLRNTVLVTMASMQRELAGMAPTDYGPVSEVTSVLMQLAGLLTGLKAAADSL